MKTFKAMWALEWRLVFRNWKSMILSLGIPVTFFLLFAGTYDVSSYPSEVQQMIFRQVLMSMTASSVLSLVLYTLPYALQEDRVGNRLRMIAHSPVPMWQYYLVKMLRLLCYFTLAVIVVFAVGYLVKGIEMPVRDWVMSVVFVLVGAIAMLPLGVLFSLIKSSETMSVVTNIAYMGLAILGGLWYPMQSFPTWLQEVVKLTPTHHYLNLFVSYYEGSFSFKSLAILAGYAMIILAITMMIKKRMDVD